MQLQRERRRITDDIVIQEQSLLSYRQEKSAEFIYMQHDIAQAFPRDTSDRLKAFNEPLLYQPVHLSEVHKQDFSRAVVERIKELIINDL